MNKIFMFLFSGVVAITMSACANDQSSSTTEGKKLTTHEHASTLGLELMKQHCYACHNPNTASHDEIIAPPMIAVKKHYLADFDSKGEFVNAIVGWVMNPDEEVALMHGAIKKFNIMPKQEFAEKDIQEIAAYIFDNEIERPKWFGAHEKEEHGAGGMGKNWKKAIALVDGKKWAADDKTMTHIHQLQKIIKDHGELADIQSVEKLSTSFSGELDLLFNDCTMEGPDHDALHQFLVPLIKKKDKLAEAKSVMMGKKIVEKIAKQLDGFEQFFQ